MTFEKMVINQENAIGLDKVYSAIQDLGSEYPGFKEWYFKKVVSQLRSGRKILAVFDENNLAGILITKNDSEKKICTLRVDSHYRHQGLGSYLIKNSYDILNTQKPLITVSENHLFQFHSLFTKYGFDYVKSYLSYYLPGKVEYCFNGTLVNSNNEKLKVAL